LVAIHLAAIQTSVLAALHTETKGRVAMRKSVSSLFKR
jgi:hypothetical protein